MNFDLYDSLRRVSNKNLFFYIIILITGLFYLHNKKRSVEILVALVPMLILINELNVRQQKIEANDNENKIEAIRPQPKQDMTEDKNLFDFLFSVQDFYEYNPQAYEEVIDNIDNILEIKKIIFRGSPYMDQYYQIAVSKKSNALNAFHSLIFNLPNNNFVTEKFNRAHKRLETILNVYINEMYDETQRNLISTGLDITKQVINLGPKEYNVYDDQEYTYQFY